MSMLSPNPYGNRTQSRHSRSRNIKFTYGKSQKMNERDLQFHCAKNQILQQIKIKMLLLATSSLITSLDIARYSSLDIARYYYQHFQLKV